MAMNGYKVGQRHQPRITISHSPNKHCMSVS